MTTILSNYTSCKTHFWSRKCRRIASFPFLNLKFATTLSLKRSVGIWGAPLKSWHMLMVDFWESASCKCQGVWASCNKSQKVIHLLELHRLTGLFQNLWLFSDVYFFFSSVHVGARNHMRKRPFYAFFSNVFVGSALKFWRFFGAQNKGQAGQCGNVVACNLEAKCQGMRNIEEAWPTDFTCKFGFRR